MAALAPVTAAARTQLSYYAQLGAGIAESSEFKDACNQSSSCGVMWKNDSSSSVELRRTPDAIYVLPGYRFAMGEKFSEVLIWRHMNVSKSSQIDDRLNAFLLGVRYAFGGR